MSASEAARHLYVHVPFCEHRCGYCDFVTAVGRRGQHGAYVDALLGELELQSSLLDHDLETVYIGGGTPTFLEPGVLARLLGALPAADELTVEANPETLTPELAELLAENGVNRVSLGAQTFQAPLLSTLERRAGPQAIFASVPMLRRAGLDNVSLDLIYGIPGQSVNDLARDLECVLDLAPEHISAYELEAKPGTRFAHAYGDELQRQANGLEHYMEQVTQTLQENGYSWYETANFSREESDGGRDLRSRHNLGYWLAHDYVGIGVGAVSTVAQQRWTNQPGLARYLAAAGVGELPPSTEERIAPAVRLWEQAMMGLRLEDGVETRLVEPVLDPDGFERMTAGQLVACEGERMRLTRRGRMLGGAVTLELLLDPNELASPVQELHRMAAATP
ncbi:MAG: radical SAM family heme chaperone HemW [Gaiellaceae bacterium]